MKSCGSLTICLALVELRIPRPTRCKIWCNLLVVPTAGLLVFQYSGSSWKAHWSVHNWTPSLLITPRFFIHQTIPRFFVSHACSFLLQTVKSSYFGTFLVSFFPEVFIFQSHSICDYPQNFHCVLVDLCGSCFLSLLSSWLLSSDRLDFPHVLGQLDKQSGTTELQGILF